MFTYSNTSILCDARVSRSGPGPGPCCTEVANIRLRSLFCASRVLLSDLLEHDMRCGTTKYRNACSINESGAEMLLPLTPAQKKPKDHPCGLVEGGSRLDLASLHRLLCSERGLRTPHTLGAGLGRRGAERHRARAQGRLPASPSFTWKFKV